MWRLRTLRKWDLSSFHFTIKDVRDKNGYLDSLGKPRIAQVKRDADIATVEAEKETRIKNAEASKEAQKAEIERATEIAEAEKENQLKVAEYRREQDVAKARADQAYELQSARSKQEVMEQEMQIQIIERQKQIELEEKEILRREKQYDSEVKKESGRGPLCNRAKCGSRKVEANWQKRMQRNTALKRERQRMRKKFDLTVWRKPTPNAHKGNRKRTSSV